MDQNRQSNDLFQQQPPQLTGMLNVLTILTFIGCGFSYLGTLFSYFTSTEEQVAKIREQQEALGDGGFAGKFMEGSMDVLQKSYDYKHLLLASGLIFTTLCLIGAIRMRKLRRSGYFIYLVGELAPVVIAIGLFGSSFFGAISVVFSAIFAVLFVILYSTQLKHLVNK
jgi:hypothetical protein